VFIEFVGLVKVAEMGGNAMFKDKKAIKRDILDKFKSINGNEDYTLPPFWLEFKYLASLNNRDRETFDEAIGELVGSGIVERVEGVIPSLRLTEKGINLIE
jgi:hypothetical protein